MSDKLPHVEVHEAMCKSIGDMAKENEALKERIKQLETTIKELQEVNEYLRDKIEKLEYRRLDK